MKTRQQMIEAIAAEATEWRRELHRHPQTMYEETFASDFVAKKLTDFHASAAAAIESISAIETQELESYWEVLKAHALAHYVQERDVDEVLNELNERYVVSSIERRQRAIENQADPYGHER